MDTINLSFFVADHTFHGDRDSQNSSEYLSETRTRLYQQLAQGDNITGFILLALFMAMVVSLCKVLQERFFNVSDE